MELRKDYILDRWAYIASARGKRPKEFVKGHAVKKEGKVCSFCPGNEHLTPPEIGRIEENGDWKIRWFPNKFPCVEKSGDPIIKTDNKFFTYSSAYGDHEVIAECREHEKQLWDLPVEHIKQLFDIYIERINDLGSRENIKYVLIFKNHGKDAGTSLVHSHTQVVSLNNVPALVREKVKAVKKYSKCPYCDILDIEMGSDRRCFETENIVAFTPYAARFNYELWIFPKRHVGSITELNETELMEMAGVLQKALLKLRSIDASYNYCLQLAPDGEDMHFHIEITPRGPVWAGFEIGSGAVINSVSPEIAAEFYRG